MQNENNGKSNIVPILIINAVSIALLLAFQFFFLVRINRDYAFRTGEVLSSQIENILETNERKEQTLIETMKENYISKAKAVSYIIDNVPDLESDIGALIRIANLMSIDEIHLFDENGRIYFGTVPNYYDYSFDSGDQMAFFKPMLENKALSMCQDVTPNTAESKSMMYAICWSETGKRMVQIGIEPLRLLEEMRTNEVGEVVDEIPLYAGMSVLIADKDTEVILGSTLSWMAGHTLTDYNLQPGDLNTNGIRNFSARLNKEAVYCTAQKTSRYIILVAQSVQQINSEIPLTMLIAFIYLVIAAIIITFVVKRMTARLMNEKRNANTDAITGLLNRRAFEDEIQRLENDPRKKDLTCIMFDINGLKKTNDTYGHDTGDRELIGFSEIIRDCFKDYGTLYRIGGDEFVGFVYMNYTELEQSLKEVEKSLELWSLRNKVELSMSSGYASAEDFPELSIHELVKIADQRMYEAKTAFYQNSAHNRRRNQ